MLPHLDAAYNLARWLLRADDGAEDVVQESYLKAFRFFDGFRGENSRAWILTIVRNSCYSWLRRRQGQHSAKQLDEEAELTEENPANPEILYERAQDSQLLHRALEALPVEFREAIVLRELEGFSYKEIADILDVPLGTVMSRIARARKHLRAILLNGQGQ